MCVYLSADVFKELAFLYYSSPYFQLSFQKKMLLQTDGQYSPLSLNSIIAVIGLYLVALMIHSI